MSYIIAVFQNRNSALKFYHILNEEGLSVSVISTPKITGLGCSICVKLQSQDYVLARTMLFQYGMNDLLGFYEIKKVNNELTSRKL